MPSDKVASAKLHHLDLPKQCQQQGVKCLNTWTYWDVGGGEVI